jgi:hypothetical protein
MTPRLLDFLIAALAAAAALGGGIGIGAAIWEGGSSPPAEPPAAAAPAAAATATATATASWLFVVTADAGVITATGGNTLAVALHDTAPRAVAFTERPQREARAVKAPAVWAALNAGGAAPPNAALSFEHAGEAVVVPLELIKVVGAAPNYTVAARVLGAGGLSFLAAEMVSNGATVVRGPGGPLWAALQAGLEIVAPELFVDDLSDPPPPSDKCAEARFPLLLAPPPPLLGNCPARSRPAPSPAAPHPLSRQRAAACEPAAPRSRRALGPPRPEARPLTPRPSAASSLAAILAMHRSG